MTEWTNICVAIVMSMALITQVLIPTFRSPLSYLDNDLAQWLVQNDLQILATKLIKSGHFRLIDIVEEECPEVLSVNARQKFLKGQSKLRQKFIFWHWLNKNNIFSYRDKLKDKGVESLNGLRELVSGWKKEGSSEVFGKEFSLEYFTSILPTDIRSEEDIIWLHLSYTNGLPSSKWSWKLIFQILFLFSIVGVVVGAWVRNVLLAMTRTVRQKHSLLHFFTGKYLHPQRCTAQFLWTDPVVVGTTVAFNVQFFQRNGKPYPVSDADGVVIEIAHGVHKVGLITELGGETPSDASTARCKFSARQAGVYCISVLVANQHIKGSPFFKKFLPGPPDPSKISVVHHSSTVVCISNQAHHVLVEPRDEYLNQCSFALPEDVGLDNYSISIRESEGGWEVETRPELRYDEATRRVDIELILPRPGCYAALVTYCGGPVINGAFEIIVLTKSDFEKVGKASCRRSSEGYESRLLSWETPCGIPTVAESVFSSSKAKKVYCYVTPKQFIIKEYLLKVIPKRLATFRLCPSTKLCFQGLDRISGLPKLRIDDGCQPAVTLGCEDRNVLASVFSQFMLKNIGGSETFVDKQEYFSHAVRKLHKKKPHDRIPFAVNRHNLLESTMKVVKYFGVSDWCRNFEISFIGEEGLDWGGLRREFFELICSNLFDPINGLFVPFYDGPQAPVHPNPNRPKHLKLKHYEFAGKIVGKCLYESCLGGSYRVSVKARFTRSFLAQLIGLRVHYKHFSYDDPDLYSGKIQHLLKHGTESLDDPLYFADDITLDGEFKTIELGHGGSSKLVTDSNLPLYLDALAQSRLCSRVRHEIDAFLGGLNEIIPDNLLCIFDESELELLMCGIETYSIADMKAHHVVNGSSDEFNRVLYWFWTAVSNFTDEEMARLLQFTTGCSRLPPGGFSQLSPHFQIGPSHTYGNLPTAHTCFNQLLLPDHETYEAFEKALVLAIKEGAEGFGII